MRPKFPIPPWPFPQRYFRKETDPMTTWPVHARISGPIVMIGFGSIGKGMLPLIERHFEFDRNRFTVIDPSDKADGILDRRGVRLVREALTRDNYREILTALLTEGGGQGSRVNPSVATPPRARTDL